MSQRGDSNPVDPFVNGVAWYGERMALRHRRSHFASDGVTEIALEYEGQMSELLANSPAIGDIVAGYANVYVEDVSLSNTGEADKGTLTVAASNRLTITFDEVNWLRVDQDLRNHKIFAGGSWSLSDADRRKVEAKLNAPEDDSVETPTGNGFQLYSRLLKGQNGYAIYIPVARRTSWYLTFPSVYPCGQIATILPFALPAGYTWVATADEASRRGFYWERRQEWTGFTFIDTQIVNGA